MHTQRKSIFKMPTPFQIASGSNGLILDQQQKRLSMNLLCEQHQIMVRAQK